MLWPWELAGLFSWQCAFVEVPVLLLKPIYGKHYDIHSKLDGWNKSLDPWNLASPLKEKKLTWFVLRINIQLSLSNEKESKWSGVMVLVRWKCDQVTSQITQTNPPTQVSVSSSHYSPLDCNPKNDAFQNR